MFNITRDMVRLALERTKRDNPSAIKLTGKRKDAIDVHVVVNGKEYGRSFSMAEVRAAYGKAMREAGEI